MKLAHPSEQKRSGPNALQGKVVRAAEAPWGATGGTRNKSGAGAGPTAGFDNGA
jgi:hypothetical protein